MTIAEQPGGLGTVIKHITKHFNNVTRPNVYWPNISTLPHLCLSGMIIEFGLFSRSWPTPVTSCGPSASRTAVADSDYSTAAPGIIRLETWQLCIIYHNKTRIFRTSICLLIDLKNLQVCMVDKTIPCKPAEFIMNFAVTKFTKSVNLAALPYSVT